MTNCAIINLNVELVAIITHFIQKTEGTRLIDIITENQNLVDSLCVKSVPDIVFACISDAVTDIGIVKELSNLAINSVLVTPKGFQYKENNENIGLLAYPFAYHDFLSTVEKMKINYSEKIVFHDFFFIKGDTKGKLIKIFTKDIMCIESIQNYIKIITKSGTYTTYLTIKEMENMLPYEFFSRIHRSFIVNDSEIKSIEGHQVTLDNKTELSLGTKYKELFLNKIAKKTIKSKRQS